MQKPKIKKDWKAIGIVFLFVFPAITCTNPLGISTSNINDVDDDNINKVGIKNENEDLHDSFIFGRWGSLARSDRYLMITADYSYIRIKYLFLNPIELRDLNPGQQIITTDFTIGVITKKFIVGYCKIVVPHSKISMEVTAHNDTDNSVVWTVNQISGYTVWASNLNLELYNESGEHPSGWGYYYFTGYLRVGDEIKIIVNEDGYYSLKVTECVSNDILFESDLVKY
jgi:hypothetical protein